MNIPATGSAASPSPMKQIEEYNHHRFDNYTAWIDLQMRAEQKSKQVFFGEQPKEVLYGYEKQETLPRTRAKSPFKVLEPSFTSGTFINRPYDKNMVLSDDLFNAERTDPYHYPNVVGCTPTSHWGDYRSGSRNPFYIKDSLKRPLDKELYDSVSDTYIQHTLHNLKCGGKAPKPMDEACAKILFAPDNSVRPERYKKKQTLHLQLEPIKKSSGHWESFANPARRHIRSTPDLRSKSKMVSSKVHVDSIYDDHGADLRCQGGVQARCGFAGSWSVEQGGGSSGISQFTIQPPPMMTFW